MPAVRLSFRTGKSGDKLQDFGSPEGCFSSLSFFGEVLKFRFEVVLFLFNDLIRVIFCRLGDFTGACSVGASVFGLSAALFVCRFRGANVFTRPLILLTGVFRLEASPGPCDITFELRVLTRDVVLGGSLESQVTARAAVRHKFEELVSFSMAFDMDALHE